MSKHLLRSLLIVIVLSSCVASAPRRTNAANRKKENIHNLLPVTSSFADVDTAFILPGDFAAGKTPLSLTDLPRTETRAFVLAPGFYEADFKTYCLQPGTPAPSQNDAYFQAPLIGARKDIIEAILRNSQNQPQLEQKQIQLLLWSVVSRSDFNKLAPPVQATARQLLTPKQVFELQGGVLGVAKTVAAMLPASGSATNLQQLFDLGIHSYEAYERLAVVSGPAAISRADFKRDQWYKHKDGYYVRYFPNGYQQTKIQVYVPENTFDSTAQETENYIVFDPASLAVVPANSNAQRLGVGGPVQDVVRRVIHIIGSGNASPRSKQPNKEAKDVKVEKSPSVKN